MSIKNAKQYPQTYYARHMVQGIAGYENEKILVDANAMKKAAPTFIGKPVYVHHQNVNLDTLQQDADGYVTECFYNTLDGWLWAKMLVVSDDAIQAIKEGWSVSNAYIPTDYEDKGQHLNVDYDRKITNYNFTHLAIVPNPRYEEAKIFTPDEFKLYQDMREKELQNSKPIKETGIMFFKKQKIEVKAGEEITLDAITEVKNDKGEVIGEPSLAELIEVWNASKAKKNVKMNDDDEMDVGDGEMVAIGNMKECWAKNNAKKAKKNEAKMDDPDEESDEELEAKKNAEDEEKKKKEEEEKEKAKKRITEVANAHNAKNAKPIETSINQLARGKSRYGAK